MDFEQLMNSVCIEYDLFKHKLWDDDCSKRGLIKSIRVVFDRDNYGEEVERLCHKNQGEILEIFQRKKVLFICSMIENMDWNMSRQVQQKIWLVWSAFCYEVLRHLYLDKNKAEFWLNKVFKEFKDDKKFKEYLSNVYKVDGSGTIEDVFGRIWDKNGFALEHERILGRLYKGGYKSMLFHYNFPIFVVRNALDYSPCTLFV